MYWDSRPQHQMEVSGQFQAVAALTPPSTQNRSGYDGAEESPPLLGTEHQFSLSPSTLLSDLSQTDNAST